MIRGIGTDIVAVARLAAMVERHGERGMAKLLAADEVAQCRASPEPARFLAKRFAAKEAFGKALGTGVRAPALLTEISVGHDDLGKPVLRYGAELAAHMASQRLYAHLSISDERDYAVAFVVVEEMP